VYYLYLVSLAWYVQVNRLTHSKKESASSLVFFNPALHRFSYFYRGRIQIQIWCMGPYMPELTITSPFCRLQSRLQHMYHGQPYTNVDFNPMPESTLSTWQGLWIWPLNSLYTWHVKETICQCCQLFSRKSARLAKNAMSKNCCFSMHHSEK
jgi:hypothetical protein